MSENKVTNCRDTSCLNRFFVFCFFWLQGGLSLGAASGGYSVVVCGLLIVVASLVAKHGL